MTHSCVESLCKELGLHVPRRVHVFDFQSGKGRKPGWVSTTLELWDEHKKKLHWDLLQARSISYYFSMYCDKGDSDPKLLTQDIHNSADHWVENHDMCRVLPGNRKFVAENWPKGRDAKYVEGGETHKAVKDFLKKYITESKMKFYIKAHENFISETFHSVINKYATK
ncbi:hypothetical protein R1flu_009080 [Riccia fluitans]|uniref:Uncharacterized protein n=1 Tax=Riccia fluitans TaxID=41844 RepID=A0ABD1Z1W4_9MARC